MVMNTKRSKLAMRKRSKIAPRVARPMVKASNTAFGPVARINTAPVAIGNSVRGSKSNVVKTKLGVVVSGRDFAFTPIGSGSIQTWTMVGGTPLSPAAFSDSVLRNYMQMYQKFKWKKLIAHYITSSPTSANGDIMFYLQKDRSSVFLNQTSPQLLPFVMSDENTTIGPQWTNHSVELTVKEDWKSTDYGMHADIEDYAAGDLFLLSKTTTLDSPGYIIFDYVIEFAQLQVSPRLLTLPIPRAQWSQLNIGQTALAVVVDTPITAAVKGNNLSGGTSALPSGCQNGDVYKVIIDYTNSVPGSWVNGAAVTNVRSEESNGFAAVTMADGFTCYAVYNGSVFVFYATLTSALANGSELDYSATVAVTFNLQCWMSFVQSIGSSNLLPNF